MEGKILTTLFTLAFLYLVDVYLFLRFRKSFSKNRYKNIYFSIFFLFSFSLGITFVFYKILGYLHLKQGLYLAIILIYLPKFAIIFFTILYDFSQWLRQKFFPKKYKQTKQSSKPLSRAEFLKQGVAVAGITPFLPLGYGSLSGVQDFKVHRHQLFFKTLPKSFEYFKVAQISDLHLGSFWNVEQVKYGVELLLKQKPDVILITGDLVNRKISEATDFIDILKKVQAPLGTFAILGNHDYDDYWHWGKWNSVAKEKRVKKIQELCKELDWKLLLNETKILEKNNEKIAIVGVENWSLNKRFPQFGNLEKATKNTEEIDFKILLSHDPSHWRAKVLKHQSKIDLMLAGHTHGMQLGIDWGTWRWSPVKYLYEEWADLYQEKGQYLYVNRGFGYSEVFPARIGVLPEITIIELNRPA